MLVTGFHVQIVENSWLQDKYVVVPEVICSAIPYDEQLIWYIKPLLELSFIVNDGNDSNRLNKALLKYKCWWIKKPIFSTIQRVSKPGKRVFSSYKNFYKEISILKYQQGTAIISTSSGIMSHLKATKLKKGGEILCYIG